MITVYEGCTNSGFYKKINISAGLYKLICAFSGYINATNGSGSFSMDVWYRYNDNIATTKNIFSLGCEKTVKYHKDVVAIDFPVFKDIDRLDFGVYLGFKEDGSTFYYQNIYLVRI